ncbi:tRNA pseudouridine synthase-like 1 isoform X1 [Alosa alosa]|uniref:tRNA pseudouridine synthase-like 1 isoform X1 n=1 Tax=Alosa alosa TaxID=278164 RepID=UPI00201504D3|nr:tRNA pseudouridine synthase-like 1 isoform X1 [Alosa alosa]XP_048111192.1 tRNA pseudouridine synthase-like 1 isoform X1 [Alosa alosa]XP_048111194.1 tRNA pseudouridine synthase-like 1 isoform X1 [Alosa alosa]XP_048111195.1 tRNA pseudouridine synthase-like 1 isoform X1 [Alosa alosa]
MLQSATRYLIFFQYIGTKYSGVVKAPPHQAVLGVQNYLEDAVRSLKPVNEVAVFISSRTDTGVHALGNSAHVDIQRREGRSPFKEEELVHALNLYLKPQNIRVTRARKVDSHFSARYRAVSRTYVYRLATGVRHHTHTPLTENKLCWFLPETELDVGAMRVAGSVLLGTHDFSTFRAMSSDAPFKSPVKTLEIAKLEPGVSFASQHFNRNIQHWDLTFKSRSFLYRQVRRMTGALVAVGQGKLRPSDIQDLLEARDSLAFPTNIMAPPYGLFLTQVEYRESGEDEDGHLYLPPFLSP